MEIPSLASEAVTAFDAAGCSTNDPIQVTTLEVAVPFSLSIIVPTRNEAGNIVPLLDRLAKSTCGLTVEVIFVDDSTDDTPQVIQEAGVRFPFEVTLIVRPPERQNGLGMAVVEGMRLARFEWICVMDGDLQHPPEVIPQLLDRARITGATLIAASRLTAGGATTGLTFRRKLISYMLAFLSQLLFPKRLREVSDPLTGFFVVSRDALDLDTLRPEGFKILLEILIRSPNLQVAELPFAFGERLAGASKASSSEALRLFRQMLRLSALARQNFFQFALVGVTGLIANTLLTAAFTEVFGLFYLLSATLATQGSSLWNFVWTEGWIFRYRGLRRERLGVRLAGFLAMNNAALLLRGPIIAFLVGSLGTHYLLANLLSLFVIIILRFAVADQLIWRGPVTPAVTAASRGKL